MLGGLPLLGGCSGETPEQRIELRTRVSSEPAGPFENAWGWTVSVEEAWMSIDALVLFDGEPLASQSTPIGPHWPRWLVGTAHAHPGHYQEGSVRSEMLTPATVNLRVVTELTPSQALAGQPGSGKIVFGSATLEPASSVPSTENPEGVVVRITGRAERTDVNGVSQVHHFVAQAGPDTAPEDVTGCPFGGGPLRPEGVIELTVDLALWLDQVDFSTLPTAPEGELTPLTADARANNGFLRGLEKAAAYRFGFSENENRDEK